MSKLIKPVHYQALLDMRQTEQGIKLIKDFFQQNLSTELRLRRVTAPLFVLKGLGINDDLNGIERAVTFAIKDLENAHRIDPDSRVVRDLRAALAMAQGQLDRASKLWEMILADEPTHEDERRRTEDER